MDMWLLKADVATGLVEDYLDLDSCISPFSTITHLLNSANSAMDMNIWLFHVTDIEYCHCSFPLCTLQSLHQILYLNFFRQRDDPILGTKSASVS